MIRMPDYFLEFRDGSTDGLREIAILEQLVCHKSQEASAKERSYGLQRRNWLMIQRIRVINTLMTKHETSGK